MLSDLYSDILLAAAASLPSVRRLKTPDASSRKMSRVCGSVVEIDLAVTDNIVVDFGMDVKACALGQASAGLVAEKLIGADINDFASLYDEMSAMLKKDGQSPLDVRWEKLSALKAIREYPQRHASTLLIFEALAECAWQILNSKSLKTTS